MNSTKISTLRKLCLCMIVKDEGHIIAKTLENLIQKLPIDYWVISDTGSTDNTKEEIIRVFKTHNIVGELFSDEWKDFGYNRTKALNHAYKKSEYVVVFDADDCIFGDIVLPTPLDKDGYFFGFGTSHGIHFNRLLLINNMKKWHYKGVMHEYVECLDPPCNLSSISGNYYIAPNAVVGNRNKEPIEKYFKDALILETAYEEALEKNDLIYERYAFYCANCFRDSQKYINAIKWYKIVLKQNNWVQEKYISCLRLFQCYKAINKVETGFYYLVESFKYDNTRAECLYELVQHYSSNNDKPIAYKYYSMYQNFYEANYKEEHTGKLFLDIGKFNFYLPYHMIIVSYYDKQFQTGITMYKIIFTKKFKEFNEFYVKHVLYNLQFYIEHVDPSDTEFFTLYQSYLIFLLENKYPLENHSDLTSKYAKYLMNVNISTVGKPVDTLQVGKDDLNKNTKQGITTFVQSDNSTTATLANDTKVLETKDVVLAILAKNEGHSLSYYLSCIYKQTYDKKHIHLYIRTNDNTDDTSDILSQFIDDHKHEYASIYFDNTNISDNLQTYTKHEWNNNRFAILGKIRQDSINYALQKNAHYFVVDCDNFITSDTLDTMAKYSEMGVVAPMLGYHAIDTIKNNTIPQHDVYSNYHDEVTDNGYYKSSSRYHDIRWNRITGLHNVSVVHCTYFIHTKFLSTVNYNDDTERYEYVIFSDVLRKNKIQQYIDNTKFYGFISFAENKEEFSATLDYWKDKMDEETTTINI